MSKLHKRIALEAGAAAGAAAAVAEQQGKESAVLTKPRVVRRGNFTEKCGKFPDVEIWKNNKVHFITFFQNPFFSVNFHFPANFRRVYGLFDSGLFDSRLFVSDGLFDSK